MPAPRVDAFDRKPLRTVSGGWRLADEPHVVTSPDPTAEDVCVSSAAGATVAGDCRPDVAERDGRSDADSCWRSSLDRPDADSAVLAMTVRA